MNSCKPDINLLPWRKTNRARAKKKRLLYGVAGVIVASVMVLLVHYFVTQFTNRVVLSHSTEHAVAQDVYRNQQKAFKKQFRKTIAKAGQQSLDSLHFIGLLKDDSKTWALISQSDGSVLIIMPGDYLGKDHGRVVGINEEAIEIEKTVWGKQGLEKKKIVLSLR